MKYMVEEMYLHVYICNFDCYFVATMIVVPCHYNYALTINIKLILNTHCQKLTKPL